MFLPLMGMLTPLTAIQEQVFSNVPALEDRVTLYNGAPGLKALDVIVNGTLFSLGGLQDHEERSVSITLAMTQGEHNTIILRGFGQANASAEIMIAEGDETVLYLPLVQWVGGSTLSR